MSRSILQRIGVALLAFLGWSFFQEYRQFHSYYESMLATATNRNVVVFGLLFAVIPSAYIVFSKKRSFWTTMSLVVVSFILFGFSYLLAKNGIIGGHIKFILNVVRMLSLAIYMICSFAVLGDYIQTKVLRLSYDSVFGVLLSIGLGLVACIILNYILVLANLFHPVLTWLQFLGAGFLLWKQHARGKHLWHILDSHIRFEQGSLVTWIVFFLLLVSFWYLYNGFMLAYIPYSTAWDANHAYMFYPKMRASNYGYFWNNQDMAIVPHLWYVFIAYRFSLFQPFGAFFGISPDSYAIMMNFWSGFFVLLFGLGLVTEFVGFLAKKDEETTQRYALVICMGWFLLLQRLSSGMGAFLVFIDNKTDLGVLALVVLAIYSGFVFLRSIQEQTKISTNLIAVSGFLFAVAGMAKPTALFDVVNFGAFLWATWFGGLGALGIVLLIIGIVASLKIMGINDYISIKNGYIASGGGLVAFLLGSLRGLMNSAAGYMKYVMIWALSFVCGLVILKAPYFIASNYFYNTDISPSNLIKGILFSKSTQETGLAASDVLPLYAQLGNPQATQFCTLSSKGLSDPKDLYKNLKQVPGSAANEDFGRYVGYGWKGNPDDVARGIPPFKNSRWAYFFAPGCYGASDAVLLCEQYEQWKSLDVQKLELILASVDKKSEVSIKLTQLIETRKKGISVEQTKIDEVETLRWIENYMQDATMKVVDNGGVKEIYLPYKYLNFFNITFNRSLQNLSSYYTDIGIIWLLLICFSVFGLVYGLVQRKGYLVSINLVTLFGWAMWMVVASGILRYGIGIVIWSILSFLALLRAMIHPKETLDSENNIAGVVFLVLFVCIGLLQLTLNMVRIASQGGSGPFLWYKSNYGTIQQVNAQGQLAQKGVSNYGYDEILGLQFPHYLKPIEILNARAKGQGVVIAGTYLRYFMENQDNTKGDGFLTEFWKNASDNDPCLTYLRMKDQKLQYYVIDQNIATVVQGDANKALFERFFAKLNADGQTIDEHGAMTMIAKMVQEGYMKLVSTSNLGTKYALTLSDASFQGLSGDQITLLRARMMAPRFFGQAAVQPIIQIAEARVKDGTFVNDIADVLGKKVDETKLFGLVQKTQLAPIDLLSLTEDEKFVLLQFLGLKQQQSQNPTQYQQSLQNLLMQSISGGSQLMVLEVVQ